MIPCTRLVFFRNPAINKALLVRTLYFYLPELCSVFITSKAVNAAAARARRRRSVFFILQKCFR